MCGKFFLNDKIYLKSAEVAKLADALASGASVQKDIGVQVSSSAQSQKNYDKTNYE